MTETTVFLLAGVVALLLVLMTFDRQIRRLYRIVRRQLGGRRVSVPFGPPTDWGVVELVSTYGEVDTYDDGFGA